MTEDFPDIEIWEEGLIFLTLRIADAKITFDFTGRVIQSDNPVQLHENPEKYGLIPGNHKLKKILDAFKERVVNKRRIYDKINEKFKID
jgi:hypothetical protein